MQFIELHINGALAIFDPGSIFAVIPPKKGVGSLVCQSTDDYIQVDETVEEVHDILSNVLEVELIANDS